MVLKIKNSMTFSEQLLARILYEWTLTRNSLKRTYVEQTQVSCLVLTYSWQQFEVLPILYYVQPSPSGYLQAFRNCLYHLHLSASKMHLKPAQHVTFRILAATARIKIHSLRFINSLTKPYKICILLWVPGLFLGFIPPHFRQCPSLCQSGQYVKGCFSDKLMVNTWMTCF